ncbi:MAG TPA: serine/threonine-protein kinase, partial [Acidobacteriota bacterium]|nr:serine/threonine-protein kinase [Acidobacteriota bacterium]
SDLYSLGIILYEIFTGCVPFQGDSPISIGFKHLKEGYTPIQVLQPGLPAQLAAIVDRLLQKDPAHRYQSVRELRRDLEALNSLRLPQPEKPPTLEERSPEVQRETIN